MASQKNYQQKENATLPSGVQAPEDYWVNPARQRNVHSPKSSSCYYTGNCIFHNRIFYRIVCPRYFVHSTGSVWQVFFDAPKMQGGKEKPLMNSWFYFGLTAHRVILFFRNYFLLIIKPILPGIFIYLFYVYFFSLHQLHAQTDASEIKRDNKGKTSFLHFIETSTLALSNSWNAQQLFTNIT